MRRFPFIALTGVALLSAACDSAQRPDPSPMPEHATAVTQTPSNAEAPSMPPPPTAPPPAGSTAESSASRTYEFDADRVGAAPEGFSFGRTGTGRAGRWVVQAEADAPSRPSVLAQLDTDDTDYRFPVAVADAPSLRDLRISVLCKPVSGRVDQACGLAFRYRDENNYFVTRANALENNIRLYYVKDGSRRQIASWSGTVISGAWHEYVVEARGDHIEVFWDGTRVLDHHDSTFMDAGRVGVWTKADSVTYFDDIAVAPLPGGAP